MNDSHLVERFSGVLSSTVPIMEGLADELPASGLLFPLSLKNTDENDASTVRTILAVDENEK